MDTAQEWRIDPYLSSSEYFRSNLGSQCYPESRPSRHPSATGNLLNESSKSFWKFQRTILVYRRQPQQQETAPMTASQKPLGLLWNKRAGVVNMLVF